MEKNKLIELAYNTSLLYAADFPGEPFHSDYKKDKDIFRRLIKSDRELERGLKKYFADLAERLVRREVSWMRYTNKITKGSEIDDWILVDWDEEALSIKVLLTDALQEAIVAGGMLMELESKIDIGWQANTPDVLDFLNKYGLKMAKGLNKTTKEKIKSALSLSLENGEILSDAQSRLTDIIDDPARAATISRTESVRAFGAGRKAVADELGWGFKEWHTTIAPCPICADLPRVGRIPIDKPFDRAMGIESEPAHPNCRCSVRYFKNEEGDE